MIQYIGRFFFISSLLVVFIKFFGHPSYVKYRRNETLISASKVTYNWKIPPAITISTWRKYFEKGWEKDVYYHNLKENCAPFENYNKLVNCINEQTFDFSKILKGAINGDDSRSNITNTSFWREDFNNFNLGKQVTLNNSYEVGTDSRKLEIYFEKGRNYTVLVHDPNFFLYTVNPDTIPQVRISIDDSKSHYVYIKAIYHVLLDKLENPCQVSRSYSFTACIKNSLSRRIGCRLPWDSWSSPDIPECHNMDQLLQFEETYEMIDNWELDSIMNLSGCQPPCSYTEYKIVSDIKSFGDEPGVVLLLSSSKVELRSEKIIYSLESFVSEFGGALGLFLGFSFIMLWDGLTSLVGFILLSYKDMYRKNQQ